MFRLNKLFLVLACARSLPKEQTKAKKLVEAFADENIYLKPAVTEAKSWHDDLAIKLKLGSEDWYYGAIPRDKAERLVLDQACGTCATQFLR